MPAMASIAQYYDTSFATVNLTMSAYLFGNAIGQFFGGSLSDQIGRKPVGVMGLMVFFGATTAIVLAPNIETMQWLRVVQAVGGGFATVICIAQVRDIFPVQEVTRRYANVVVVMLLAPIIAPSIGAALVQFGWQSIFILLAAVSFVLLVMFVFVMPETNTNTRNSVSVTELFSGYWKVINHRVDGRITAIRYALFLGFSSGILLCFLTNAAMIFMHHFKLSEAVSAAWFAGAGVSMIIGNRLAFIIASRMPASRWLKRANLIQIMAISSLIVLSLTGTLTVWLLTLLTLIIICMSGSIMPTSSGQYIAFFDRLAGSAASLSTTLVFGLGAGIGGIAAVLSRGSNITLIFIVMLISALIAMIILTTIHEPRLKSET